MRKFWDTGTKGPLKVSLAEKGRDSTAVSVLGLAIQRRPVPGKLTPTAALMTGLAGLLRVVIYYV